MSERIVARLYVPASMDLFVGLMNAIAREGKLCGVKLHIRNEGTDAYVIYENVMPSSSTEPSETPSAAKPAAPYHQPTPDPSAGIQDLPSV
jgi:hypothetical protein